MTTSAQIKEVVALYVKYGWKLRRVLLSSATADLLASEASELFGDAELRQSLFDALWFSRRSRMASESWELRRLTGTPFALVEVIDDGTPDDEIENTLAETESRMAETLTRGNGSV
jgi:hypothetical protein